MSKTYPNLIKAYRTFDNRIVIIKEDLLSEIINRYDNQEKIPDTEIIEAKFLELEQNEITPVYEIVGEGEVYRLRDLKEESVRCSNCEKITKSGSNHHF